MRISDWSSDVCSSDLMPSGPGLFAQGDGADCSATQRFYRIMQLEILDTLVLELARGQLEARIDHLVAFECGIVEPDFVDQIDRKSVVEGKSVSVRVDLGGRRIIKTKRNNVGSKKVKKIKT